MKVVDFVGFMGNQRWQVSAALRPAFDIGFTQCQHIGGWLLATRCGLPSYEPDSGHPSCSDWCLVWPAISLRCFGSVRFVESVICIQFSVNLKQLVDFKQFSEAACDFV